MFNKIFFPNSIVSSLVNYLSNIPINMGQTQKLLAYREKAFNLNINLSNTRGKSIDDIFIQFKQLATENPNIIQHSKVEVLQEKSELYFDKFSIIRLTISDGENYSVKEITLDSEIHSGHDYLLPENSILANILPTFLRKLFKPIYKFNPEKLKTNIDFISVQPKHQFGATCKLVAIAQVAEIYEKDRAPPTYKNGNGRYVYYENQQKKEYIEKNTLQSSIRSLAKQHAGSMQGEILDSNDMVKLLSYIGYNTDVNIPKNINEYRQQIRSNFVNNKASIVFFSVSTRSREHSNVFTAGVDEMFEHVATITGYDSSSDKVRLTHWGNHYWQPIADVFASSNNLVETRSEEYYKINHKNSIDGAWKYKQMSIEEIQLIKHLSLEELSQQGIKKTKAPAPNTGFKGKLFSVYPK